MKSLVVVGLGYVGLPMALRAAEVGIHVTGLDVNQHVVDHLNAGCSHIGDVSDEELEAGRQRGFLATTNPRCIAAANVVIVCVPTPRGPAGGPDLTAVEQAAEVIGRHLAAGTLVVLESTSYPGTTEEAFAPRVLAGRDWRVGVDIFVAFSPERIDPGNRRFTVQNTPKVVGGMTPRCTSKAAVFYRLFVDQVIEAKGAREAEMAKLIENTFRHVNIALVNEMVRFSEELDIDLWDAIDCAASKPFGFLPFRPGPGVGGHCIPVDPSYLSHRVKAKLGYAFRMVELAEEINAAMPGYVAHRVWRLLNEEAKSVRGSQILLLGVTYKPDVADCRESPADPLAARLLAWGADVSYHDPFVPEWRPRSMSGADVLTSVANLDAAIRRADLVVLLQPHACYDLNNMASFAARLLDTRGVAPDAAVVERL